MLSLRLGLRLLRGGGRGGLVRLLLVSLGVAIAVLSALLALAVPRLTSAQTDRSAARLPVFVAAGGGSGAFAERTIPDQLDGRLWQHLLVTGPDSAPAPPGLPRLPRPGETWRSPALQTLLAERGLADGPAPTGLIGERGLTDPDELLDYVGLTPEAFGEGGQALRFGADPSTVQDELPRNRIALQLVLLVGLPAAAYLATSAQLSAATRARRLAALRLIGVGSRTMIGAAAVEAAAAGLLGAVLGLAAYPPANLALARSGALGFTWFPGDTALSLPLVVLTLIVVVAVSARTGLSGMRRVLARPLDARKEPDVRPGSWWGLVPLLAGLGVLTPFVVQLLRHRFAVVTFTSGLNVVIAAALTAVLGLLLTLRPATRLLAGLLTSQKRSLPVRLAARRLQLDAGSALRVISGLVMVLLVAAIGPVALRDGRLAVAPPTDRQAITVAQLNDPAVRSAVFRLDAAAKVAIVPGEPNAPDQAAGRPIVVATCASLRLFVQEPLPDCQDGTALRLLTTDRAGAQVALAPGAPVIAPGLTTAPDPLLTVLNAAGRLPTGAVLLTSTIDAADLPDRTQFSFTASGVAAGDRLRFAIRELAPSATPGTDLNVQDLRTYAVLRGTTYVGMSLGFLLGLLAFLVATADRAVERRNNVAAMIVLGLPIATLRRAQILQVLLPLAVALTLAAIVGNVAGLAWLGAGGLQDGLYTTGLTLSLTMAAAGIALAVAAGTIVPGRRPKVQHLRRE